jgi:hypothetical protein
MPGRTTYSPAQKLRAMKLFTHGLSPTIADTAEAVGVKVRTVQSWCNRDGWYQLRSNFTRQQAELIRQGKPEAPAPDPPKPAAAAALAESEAAALVQLEKVRGGFQRCNDPGKLKVWIQCEDAILSRLERLRAGSRQPGPESPGDEAPAPSRSRPPPQHLVVRIPGPLQRWS